MRTWQWLMAFVLMSCAGCFHDVDRDILATRQAYHEVVRFHAEGIQAKQEQLLDRVVADNARLEREALQARQDAWLATHTDESGGLVSRKPDGTIVPMPKDQLLAFLEKRDRQLGDIMEHEQNYSQISTMFKQARTRLVALTEKLGDKEVAWEEQKESAQAEIDQILNMTGTFIGGLTAGGAIMW